MTKYVHYTTLPSLHSILEKKELWATSIRFLNDQRELEDALDLVAEVLSTAKDVPNINEFRKHFEHIRKTVADYAAETLFVVSFSQNDLLSQWRGYSPDHNGYAIELDLEGVEFEGFGMAVVDCVYDRSEKERLVRLFLNDRFSTFQSSLRVKEERQFLNDAIDALMRLAAQFKDEAFDEEKERRIIASPFAKESILYRPGRHHLVPYIPVPFKLDHVKSITVGPTRHHALAKAALQDFLEVLHYEDHKSRGKDAVFAAEYEVPKVTLSAIPFRV